MARVLKHNGVEVDLDAAHCELGSLTMSFLAPWSLTLRRAIAFDEPTDWQNEDSIELERDGTAVFVGRIKSSERLASAGSEHVEYTCTGLREVADGITFQRTIGGTATARVVYNCPAEEEVEEAGYVAIEGTAATVGEIVADILDTMAGALADIIGNGTPGSGTVQAELDALAMVPPKVVLNGTSVDEAIRTVLRHAPDFGFHIEAATRQARFTDFRELAAKDVAGVGGSVLRQQLDFSTATCYSACTVQGTYELVDIFEALSPAWDPALEGDWTSSKGSDYPDTYGRVWRYFATSEPGAVGGAVMPQRFVGTGDIIARITIAGLNTFTFTVTAKPVDDTHILVNTYARQWSISLEKYVAASVVRARFTYRTGRIAGRYPAAGHTGTANTRRGLTRELFLIDEERGRKTVRGTVNQVFNSTTFRSFFEYIELNQVAGKTIEFNGNGAEYALVANGHGWFVLGEAPAAPLAVGQSYLITVQDDTRKEFEGGTLTILEKYAKETLERVMDERFVGSVPLSGLDWAIALGQKINFTDTNDPEYTALGATLIAVEHDFAQQRTVLSLTSDRAFGGTITWDELEHQRRRDRSTEENAIQIRRLWRRLRARRSPEGAIGDPQEEDPNGPLTGDDIWIEIDEEKRKVNHIGPGPVDRSLGGEGKFIEWIDLDERGHVLDAGVGTFS